MFETLAQAHHRVESCTREALAQAAGGRTVPRDLVEAITRGTGAPETVRRKTSETFGTDKPLELVLFDTDRIFPFVFESSRPPVIAGASRILRDLHTAIARDPVHGRFAVYSAGGEGLFLVPRGEGERLCQSIQERYNRSTAGALAVTTGWICIGPDELIASEGEESRARDGALAVSGTRAVLARLRDVIRREKQARLPPRAVVTSGSPRCISCRDRAGGSADIKKYRPEESGLLCEPCDKRWAVGKQEIQGTSFDEIVEWFLATLPDPETPGARGSYTGFVYADGNAMGALFGKLSSLAELRFLSLAVEHAFEATKDETFRMVAAIVRQADPQRVPLVSYLGGGDEAIWILPGALAIRVADRLHEWLDRATGRIRDLAPLLIRYGRKKLTVGTGLVLCHLGYPIRYQFQLAERLKKNAKELFYDTVSDEVESSIDFEVLTDSSPLSDSLKVARQLAYGTQDDGFFRSCRPYIHSEFRDLLEKIRKAQQAGIAKSQLYLLQEGALEGKAVFLNHLRYQIARKPAGPRYQEWLRSLGQNAAMPQAIERFFMHPLRKEGAVGTWVPDVIQLAPFLDLLSRGRGE